MSILIEPLGGAPSHIAKVGRKAIGWFKLTFPASEIYVAGGVSIDLKPFGMPSIGLVAVSSMKMPDEQNPGEYDQGWLAYTPATLWDGDAQKLQMFSDDGINGNNGVEEFSANIANTDLVGIEIEFQAISR